MNKHLMPTQPTKKSPNNYSISTLHYMERYHLIGSEKNYNSGIYNLLVKLSSLKIVYCRNVSIYSAYYINFSLHSTRDLLHKTIVFFKLSNNV